MQGIFLSSFWLCSASFHFCSCTDMFFFKTKKPSSVLRKYSFPVYAFASFHSLFLTWLFGTECESSKPDWSISVHDFHMTWSCEFQVIWICDWNLFRIHHPFSLCELPQPWSQYFAGRIIFITLWKQRTIIHDWVLYHCCLLYIIFFENMCHLSWLRLLTSMHICATGEATQKLSGSRLHAVQEKIWRSSGCILEQKTDSHARIKNDWGIKWYDADTGSKEAERGRRAGAQKAGGVQWCAPQSHPWWFIVWTMCNKDVPLNSMHSYKYVCMWDANHPFPTWDTQMMS
jgi:hypothetical protein